MSQRSLTQTQAKSSFIPVQTGLLQRKCASCSQHTIVGSGCTQCQKQQTSLQRSATGQSELSEVPPIVDEVLQSPGQPLDSATRTFMESPFGHDFSRVQVHTDAKAAASAEAVNALAYTVGQDIVFGTGQFAPTTYQGKSLIAHELAHTIQQSQSNVSGIGSLKNDSQSEREADAGAHAVLQHDNFRVTSATVPHLSRQPSPTVPTTSTSTTPAPMSRAEFEKNMTQQYRVKLIRTGTFQDQKFGDLTPDRWHSWDPGSSSTTYSWIVEAFSQVEKTFGGLPPVSEIVFFETNYIQTTPGHAEAQPKVGASYFNGQLIIYKAMITGNTMRQINDSFAKPTEEQAVHRNIAHELGHGIAETALDQPGTKKPPGAEPGMMKQYRRAVGWTATAPDKLYDIQAPGVEDALNHGTPPPADAHITEDKWNFSKWKERPLTGYMVDNPGDDFAEAIMAYVNEPNTLKALSPHRYEFLEKHKSKWLHPERLNVWESVKRGGQPRALQPSSKPTIWERALKE